LPVRRPTVVTTSMGRPPVNRNERPMRPPLSRTILAWARVSRGLVRRSQSSRCRTRAKRRLRQNRCVGPSAGCRPGGSCVSAMGSARDSPIGTGLRAGVCARRVPCRAAGVRSRPNCARRGVAKRLLLWSRAGLMRPETKRTRRSAPAASRVAASDAVRPTVTLAIRPGASRPGWLPLRPRDVSELETEDDREVDPGGRGR
jgi:hypothetical protein